MSVALDFVIFFMHLQFDQKRDFAFGFKGGPPFLHDEETSSMSFPVQKERGMMLLHSPKSTMLPIKQKRRFRDEHTDIPCNDRLAQFKTQNLDSKFVLTYTRKLLSGASHRDDCMLILTRCAYVPWQVGPLVHTVGMCSFTRCECRGVKFMTEFKTCRCPLIYTVKMCAQ